MCSKKTFDELVQLFKDDPAAFEQYKKECIEQKLEEMCHGCPECINRCKQMQWRIDQELNKYKNPIARYNAMVSMFWEQTTKFQSALAMETPKKPTRNATLIQFPQKG